MSGSPPSSSLDCAEQVEARPGPPAAVLRGLVVLGDRPVGDEAAEVVDAAYVDEFERAAEALAPPAVAGRAVRGPVVERIPPDWPDALSASGGAPATASGANSSGQPAKSAPLSDT